MKITLGRQDMLSFSLIFSLVILVKYFGFFKEGRKKGGGSGCITGYGMLILIHSVPLRVWWYLIRISLVGQSSHKLAINHN